MLSVHYGNLVFQRSLFIINLYAATPLYFLSSIMVVTTQAFGLVILFASLFLDVTVIASPLESGKGVDLSAFRLNRRQDPGPGAGSVDASAIEPEDEDLVQIAADGTGPLRSGKSNQIV